MTFHHIQTYLQMRTTKTDSL